MIRLLLQLILTCLVCITNTTLQCDNEMIQHYRALGAAQLAPAPHSPSTRMHGSPSAPASATTRATTAAWAKPAARRASTQLCAASAGTAASKPPAARGAQIRHAHGLEQSAAAARWQQGSASWHAGSDVHTTWHAGSNVHTTPEHTCLGVHQQRQGGGRTAGGAALQQRRRPHVFGVQGAEVAGGGAVQSTRQQRHCGCIHSHHHLQRGCVGTYSWPLFFCFFCFPHVCTLPPKTTHTKALPPPPAPRGPTLLARAISAR